MRRLGALPVLLFAVVSVFVTGDRASAQTTIYNNQIQVTGIVLPAQHILVDEQGDIIEILSNTEKDVTPKVYLYRIAKENLRELTPEIYENYRNIVPLGTSHVGTLYHRTAGSFTLMPIDTLQGTREVPYDLHLSE